jgi:hypothetical protein
LIFGDGISHFKTFKIWSKTLVEKTFHTGHPPPNALLLDKHFSATYLAFDSSGASLIMKQFTFVLIQRHEYPIRGDRYTTVAMAC